MRWRASPRLRRFISVSRGLGRPVLLSAVAVALVACSGYAVSHHIGPRLSAHSYFVVREVRLSADTPHVEAAELAIRAGIYQGTSIWEVDVAAAERAIARLDWVKTVRVVRRFPDTVRIHIEERRPLAITRLVADPHLVAEDGTLYALPAGVPLPDLPWVTGWQSVASRGARASLIRRAVSLADEAKRVGIGLSQIDCEADGSMTAYLEAPKVPVILGRGFTPAESLARLVLLLEHLTDGQRDSAQQIDLSFDRRAIVTTGGGRDAEHWVRSKRWEPGRG